MTKCQAWSNPSTYAKDTRPCERKASLQAAGRPVCAAHGVEYFRRPGLRMARALFAPRAVLLLLCLLTGCISEAEQKARQKFHEQTLENNQRAFESCWKQGGFLVRSAWDGRPVDCVAPKVKP